MPLSHLLGEPFLKTILGTMNEGFSHQQVIYNHDGQPIDYKILYVNPAYEKLMGKEASELIGHTMREIKPNVNSSWIELCAQVALSGQSCKTERYVSHAKRHFKIEIFSHELGEFSTLFVDVTDKIQSKEVAFRYRSLLESSPDIVLFINREGIIIDANNAALSTYGYTLDELIGSPITKLRTDASLVMFKNQFQTAVSSGVRFETEHQRKDGTIFPVEVSSKSASEQGETLIMSIVRDITLQKQHECDIKRMATCDILTDTFNRLGLYEQVELLTNTAKVNGHQLALLYFDLDHFKAINDAYGHGAGDLILKTFAQRINKVKHPEDCLGRIGGDEFVLVRVRMDHLEEISTLLEAIKTSLAEPVAFEDVQISISASIGIALYPEHSADYHQLLQYADQAMYASKKVSGTSHTFFKKF